MFDLCASIKNGKGVSCHVPRPRALSWAQVFREDSLRPLVISDMGSRPQTAGSLPRVFCLCIRRSFIHYSAPTYCAPSLCQALCQALRKRVPNKGRMVTAVQPFPGVAEGPDQPCLLTHTPRSVLTPQPKVLRTARQMSVASCKLFAFVSI